MSVREWRRSAPGQGRLAPARALHHFGEQRTGCRGRVGMADLGEQRRQTVRQLRRTFGEPCARSAIHPRRVGREVGERAPAAAGVSVRGREIEVDVAAEACRRVDALGLAPRPLRPLLEHLPDRGGDQVVLGLEVGVETTVGQADLGHHPGDSNSLRPVGADRLGGGLQDPLPRLFLVFGAIAHGLAVSVYMTHIISRTGDRQEGDERAT